MDSLESSLKKPPEPLEEIPSQDQILQELKGRGMEVEETNEDTFSQTISYDGFEELSEDGKRWLTALAERSHSFWSGLIIKDGFEKDDDKRSAFQTEMNKKYGHAYEDFQSRSKLRVNVQASLHGLFRGVVRELDKKDQKIDTPQANAIREIYASLIPIDAIRPDGPLTERVAAEKWMAEHFPSFPSTLNPNGRDHRAQFYREYFLLLTEEQRLMIVANLDKAAHDLLQLVTEPVEKR